jgi:flavin reductase (DIM6/NTAB) family NADH-FMN oxidoreductase RutF
LSLDLPLIGVCLRRAGRSAAALRRTTHFGVSILGADQETLGASSPVPTDPAVPTPSTGCASHRHR